MDNFDWFKRHNSKVPDTIGLVIELGLDFFTFGQVLWRLNENSADLRVDKTRTVTERDKYPHKPSFIFGQMPYHMKKHAFVTAIDVLNKYDKVKCNGK